MDRRGREHRCLALSDLVEHRLEASTEGIERCLGLLDRQVAATHEGLGVELAHAAHLLDRAVHQRLGVARVIALVVAVTSVADQVDHHVLVEALPEGEGQARRSHAGLWVVAVYVEDRRLDHLGHVSRVVARPRCRGAGREPDLVVDHDVDAAAGAVARQLREVERLGHDPLPGERRVPVDQDGQHREVIDTGAEGLRGAIGGRGELVLPRPGHALDHGVHRLEVGGVRGHRHRHGQPGEAHQRAAGALVVLHVARALDALRVEVPLELREDLAVGRADDVRQEVEATTVRRAEVDRLGPGDRRRVDKRVERHDRGLRPLESEPLLAHVPGVQEPLEDLGGVQAVEDVTLLFDAHRGVSALDPRLDPGLLLRVLDVHVLDAERAAVGVAEDREDLLERRRRRLGETVGQEGPRQVPDRQAVGQGVELRVQLRGLRRERVEVGVEVPTNPVHVDQTVDLELLGDLLEVPRFRRLGGIGVLAPLRGLIGDAERGEDLVVEPMATRQPLGHVLEEQTRLSTLDDPVVIGRGDGEDLPQPEVRQHPGVGGLEARRPAAGAHAAEGALSRQQPRHRLHGAERPRIGQRDRRAGEVIRSDGPCVDLAHEILVGEQEGPEVHGVGGSDAWNHQVAGAISLLDVDGQSETDMVRSQDSGSAPVIDRLDEAGVHGRDV